MMKTSEQDNEYGLQRRDDTQPPEQTISRETQERLLALDDRLFEFRQYVSEVFSFVSQIPTKFNQEWRKGNRWERHQVPIKDIKLVTIKSVTIARVTDGDRAAERACPDHL